jgi:hypothetical protein
LAGAAESCLMVGVQFWTRLIADECKLSELSEVDGYSLLATNIVPLRMIFLVKVLSKKSRRKIVSCQVARAVYNYVYNKKITSALWYNGCGFSKKYVARTAPPPELGMVNDAAYRSSG